MKPPQTAAQVERLLLGRFAPPSLVVSEHGDIVYIHGRTGLFLEPNQGQPRVNILEMAREGLKIELAAAMRQCATQQTEVSRAAVQVKSNGDFTLVDLTVSWLTEPEGLRGLLLVTFRPAAAPADATSSRKQRKRLDASQLEELERQLQHMKESHQMTLEELETSNEELKSTNEELQSTNEELQSTNEELETSKEEMQSLNEELTTVNTELQSKVDDLSQANDDMQNLLNSTDIATVFLDNDLNIKRFTNQAKELIMLRLTDVGRPISELASNLEIEDLATACHEVLRTLVFQESEVRSKHGSWYLMRIVPYRTATNVIDGLVLTFIDINRLKRSEQANHRLATALDALQAMHEVGEFVRQNGLLQTAFRQVLEVTLAAMGSDAGTLSLLDPASGKLTLRAQIGLDEAWLEHWEEGEHGPEAWADTLRLGTWLPRTALAQSPVFRDSDVGIPQPTTSPYLSIALAPLLTSDHQLFGVITAHFKQLEGPDDRSLKSLALLAQRAAEAFALPPSHHRETNSDGLS